MYFQCYFLLLLFSKNNTVTYPAQLKKFSSALVKAFDADAAVTHTWSECADVALTTWGSDNENKFLLANVPQLRGRLIDSGVSPDELKSWKERLKTARGMVVDYAKSRNHSNPNQCWTRLLKYMKERSGLSHFKQLTKESTPTDKFLAALAQIAKHLDDAELRDDTREAAHELVGAAIVDGHLKDKK